MAGFLDAYKSEDEDQPSLPCYNPSVWSKGELASDPVSGLRPISKSKDKRKRLIEKDPMSDKFSGPWGGFEGDEARRAKLAAIQAQRQQAVDDSLAAEAAKKQEPSPDVITQFSTFHGKTSSGWLAAPASLIRPTAAPGEKACYLPKTQVHAWRGHSGGVQRMELFPGSAHLLLSCSLDSTVKIWDYYNDRQCKRTYTGHSQAVRDVKFSLDGRQFYSAGFDTLTRLWDTETGQVISTFTDDHLPFCLAVHPEQPHSVICGTSAKKAVQFDANSGKVVQEYYGHQGTVSSVTFVENGRKLLTSSDDRKLFTWVYGIPVIDRYIAEPTMHAIPAIATHPSGKFVLGQSMNNTMVVYQAGGEFKYQSKRKFVGHANSGYAIQPDFSPDGRYVISGGSEGSLHFWDWKTSNLYRSIKAHEGVCMHSLWHPVQSSRVISCGWDGQIKLWE
jgi:pre-mRNA-processing factor 17